MDPGKIYNWPYEESGKSAREAPCLAVPPSGNQNREYCKSSQVLFSHGLRGEFLVVAEYGI